MPSTPVDVQVLCGSHTAIVNEYTLILKAQQLLADMLPSRSSFSSRRLSAAVQHARENAHTSLDKRNNNNNSNEVVDVRNVDGVAPDDALTRMAALPLPASLLRLWLQQLESQKEDNEANASTRNSEVARPPPPAAGSYAGGSRNDDGEDEASDEEQTCVSSGPTPSPKNTKKPLTMRRAQHETSPPQPFPSSASSSPPPQPLDGASAATRAKEGWVTVQPALEYTSVTYGPLHALSWAQWEEMRSVHREEHRLLPGVRVGSGTAAAVPTTPPCIPVHVVLFWFHEGQMYCVLPAELMEVEAKSRADADATRAAVAAVARNKDAAPPMRRATAAAPPARHPNAASPSLPPPPPLPPAPHTPTQQQQQEISSASASVTPLTCRLALEYPPGNLVPRKLSIPLAEPLLTRQELLALVRSTASVHRHVALRVAYRVWPQPPLCGAAPGSGSGGGTYTPTTCGPPLHAIETDAAVAVFIRDTLTHGSAAVRVVAVQSTRAPLPSPSSSPMRSPARPSTSTGSRAAAPQPQQQQRADGTSSNGVYSTASRSAQSPPRSEHTMQLSSTTVTATAQNTRSIPLYVHTHSSPLTVSPPYSVQPLPLEKSESEAEADSRTHTTQASASGLNTSSSFSSSSSAPAPCAEVATGAGRSATPPLSEVVSSVPAAVVVVVSEAGNTPEQAPVSAMLLQQAAAHKDTAISIHTNTTPSEPGSHQSHTRGPPRWSEDEEEHVLHTVEAQRLYEHSELAAAAVAVAAVAPTRSEPSVVSPATAMLDVDAVSETSKERDVHKGTRLDDDFGETWRNPEYYGRHARERGAAALQQQQQQQQQQQDASRFIATQAALGGSPASEAAPTDGQAHLPPFSVASSCTGGAVPIATSTAAAFSLDDNDAPASMAGRSQVQRPAVLPKDLLPKQIPHPPSAPPSTQQQQQQQMKEQQCRHGSDIVDNTVHGANETGQVGERVHIPNAALTRLAKAALPGATPTQRVASSTGGSGGLDPLAMVFVRYEIDPTAVYVSGPVSPVVLQHLQDVIFRRCCAHLSIDVDAPRPRFHVASDSFARGAAASVAAANANAVKSTALTQDIAKGSGGTADTTVPSEGILSSEIDAGTMRRVEHVLPLFGYRFTRAEEKAMECCIAEVMSVYQGLEQLPPREAEEWARTTAGSR